MTRTTDYLVRQASWQADEAEIRSIRQGVYIIEQHVPAELEWDGLDEQAMHWLALDAQSKAIATARLLPSGQVGRMAVLAPYRQQGIGASLLRAILEAAKQLPHPPLFLNAQTYAIGFYEKFGFVAEGPVFDDAGIPHRLMQYAPNTH